MSQLTDQLWDRFGSLRSTDDLPTEVVAVANHCVLDWFGCAVAGSREPLSAILRRELCADAGPCSLVGTDRRADLFKACLVNGAAGHALDFDDTSTVMGGHASVPLMPAILALAEHDQRNGDAVITAAVVGMEVQARIGASIGADHYARGWHTTSTIGVYGAAAACSWLSGLDHEAFGRAMGLAASSASGVKANFGTMTKPLHAGYAAERGALAARLATQGYTANSAALDGNQSFVAAAGNGSLDAAVLDRWAEDWAVPRTLFKYHAACHLTHAGIEATAALLGEGIDPDEVDAITLTVNPSILDVCGIADPATGLEAKFSLRGTQALLVRGVDTAAVESFGDGPISRPDVQAFIPRVAIETDTSLATMATSVALRAGGRTLRASRDVSRPGADLEAQALKLRRKFDALTVPVLGVDGARRLADGLADLGSVSRIGDVLEVARCPG